MVGLHKYEIEAAGTDDRVIFQAVSPSDTHTLTKNLGQLTSQPTFIRPLLSLENAPLIELITYDQNCKIKIEPFVGQQK